MLESLKFLYHRIKKPDLTKEQAESKVCQEVFIMKVGSSKLMNQRIAFKGGLIIDSLAHGKRGYTKDIDFDMIKYPLSFVGLKAFINDLNKLGIFNNIKISIKASEDLNHKNYQGKRITLAFNDGKDEFHLLVDIGVYLPIVIKNNIYKYEVAFGQLSKILINPVERIIAEKLSTFAIYGTDNTRAKDLFDAYWLITHYQFNKETTFKILKFILVDRYHYFKNLSYGKKAIVLALQDKTFKKSLESTKRNWTGASLDVVIKTINKFLEN